MRDVDVLVPTYRRPEALAVALAGLLGQCGPALRVVVSDQSEDEGSLGAPCVRAVVRVLRASGTPVETHRHVPRRGVAEHRDFLLGCAEAPAALFLDDDVLLVPGTIEAMLRTLRAEACGFVGSAVIGLSHLHDVRPAEQAFEPWEGPVRPEVVTPGSAAWQRHRLHNAANLFHVERALRLPPGRVVTYRVAWVGGCVLYDAAKLRAVGGFGFWPELPQEHAGEDVVVQLRLMARFGGCGILPSGAFHLELPTTVPDRRVDAPRVLDAP
jgi:GT2 family glycosyltransferase